MNDNQNVEYQFYENYADYIKKTNEDRQRMIDDFINDDSLNSKQKIITVLEMEYNYLEMQQKALFYSNEEMLNCDINDTDVIESRAINMTFMEKNNKRMKEIKQELLNLDGDTNHIYRKDLFSYVNVSDYSEDKRNINQDIIQEIDL